MSTKPNPNQKALVGGAAVVVATVAVAEEDVTNLTYTAPVWKQMDRGREHNGSKVLILQSAVSKILTTAAGSGAFATFLGFGRQLSSPGLLRHFLCSFDRRPSLLCC